MSATTEFGTIEERVNRVVEVSHCSFLRYLKQSTFKISMKIRIFYLIIKYFQVLQRVVNSDKDNGSKFSKKITARLNSRKKFIFHRMNSKAKNCGPPIIPKAQLIKSRMVDCNSKFIIKQSNHS